MKVTNETIKLYLNELNDEELITLFEEGDKDKILFKHKDTSICFSTDGSNIYVFDIDNTEINIFPLAKNGDTTYYEVLESHYNNFNDFITTFQHIEELLNYELFITDGLNKTFRSIRQLELYHKNSI